MIGLILVVLTCTGGHQTVDQCPTEKLSILDSRTWIGPTESDMRDCIDSANSLIQNGERAKCEVVDADVIAPASFDYRPTAKTLTF